MEAEARIRVPPTISPIRYAGGRGRGRPASVVKELVENALDAGARRIDIDVEGGWRRSIRVVDDGHGMNPGRGALSLRRHATPSDADRGSVRPPHEGFARGLPSIAGVSRFQ